MVLKIVVGLASDAIVAAALAALAAQAEPAALKHDVDMLLSGRLKAINDLRRIKGRTQWV